jgi:nicotinamide mononucleotide (NMN) deamidase PncC
MRKMGTFGIIVSRLLSKASSKFKDGGFVVQQIRNKSEIQKVDKMEEKRQRNSYLSFRVT